MSELRRIKEVKARYEQKLMAFPGVVGVGIGMRYRGGQDTGEICIVVMVQKKQPLDLLNGDSLIPENLEGVRVDVQEVGEITAFES